MASSDGALYGVAGQTAFSLKPSELPGVPWTYGVLCTNFLALGTIAVGPAGALYGAGGGGAFDVGAVLSIALPTSPGGACTDTILYSFAPVRSGYNPRGGVVMGARGALYGVTVGSETGGREPCGSVYTLEPPSLAGGAWTYKPVSVFSCNGGAGGVRPMGTLAISNGVLYGTTGAGGAYGDGTVFSLTP